MAHVYAIKCKRGKNRTAIEKINKLHKNTCGNFTGIRRGFVHYPLVKLWKWCYHL